MIVEEQCSMVGSVYNPPFTQDGRKTLVSRKEIHPDMLMDINVHQLKRGEVRTFRRAGDEMALLLIQGDVTFRWNGQSVRAVRKDFFNERPWCLHVPKDMEIMVEASGPTELLEQATDNASSFSPCMYTPADCEDVVSGAGLYGGEAVRTVRTIFDHGTAPYSNFVCGEVLHSPGQWSSYIPHHHPQPEVYYYRFDKPQGFGAAFVGDDAFKITDGAVSAITPGKTHPQACAPGYRMYYVWMIRHLPGDPWDRTRIDAPAHIWLLSEGK